jgi:hypothetical protein
LSLRKQEAPNPVKKTTRAAAPHSTFDVERWMFDVHLVNLNQPLALPVLSLSKEATPRVPERAIQNSCEPPTTSNHQLPFTTPDYRIDGLGFLVVLDLN